jgi:hypothetical protein
MEILIEVLIIIFAASGLISHSRAEGGARRKHQFMYYTSLSNLIVLIYYAARLLPPFESFLKGPALWFSVAMAIAATFVIYHFIVRKELRKKAARSGETKLKFFSYGNLSGHYFTPALAFVDWALFADKDLLKYSAGWRWIAIPMAYAAFSFARGAKGGNLEYTDSPYPYGFMDPVLNGWKKIAFNISALSICMITSGFLIIWIFNFFSKIF